jgi:hypothetical protein
MSNVVRIDIDEELRAAERGECLACRMGGRHGGAGLACPGAKHWGDVWCSRGKHDVPLVEVGIKLVRRGTCAHCGVVVSA